MRTLLLCDTAGRLHNKKNLMEELRKINRIIDREYPEAFRETLVVLDGTHRTERPGAGPPVPGSRRYHRHYPDEAGWNRQGRHRRSDRIGAWHSGQYIGVGREHEDLQKFDADQFVNALFHRRIKKRMKKFRRGGISFGRSKREPKSKGETGRCLH